MNGNGTLAASTWVWSATVLFLLVALKDGWRLLAPGLSLSGREKRALVLVSSILHEFQDLFEAGLVPGSEKWEALKELPAPWGQLTYQSVVELRSRGGSVLPTIRRLRDLVERHSKALQNARARSSQALAQALACGALVPLFGAVLYLLLPGVDSRPWLWFILSCLAFLGAAVGALWLVHLADHARWGGLQGSERSWVIAAQCAGERLLSLIRAGQPPDLAWAEAVRFLSVDSPDLARLWGFQVYESVSAKQSYGAPCRRALVEAGEAIRRAIQVSLMEGRACSERIEGVLLSLRSQIDAGIEQELSLLGTRALKPLFVCVAPALFGLLGAGVFLTWKAALV